MAAAAGAGAGANYPITPPGGAVALNTTWQRAEWVSHPGPLLEIVQEALRSSPCADVKPVLALVVQHLQRTDIFGPNEWQKFFNAQVPRAPVSLELDTVLQTPCPFWPERLVRETHEVVYIPATVNGEALSSDRMSKLLLEAPPSTPVVSIEISPCTLLSSSPVNLRALNLRLPIPHWVLISKEPIPGSIGPKKDASKALSKPFDYSHMTSSIPAPSRAVWQAPLLEDALICIAALFAQKGTWLYHHGNNIQTRHAETQGGLFVIEGRTTERYGVYHELWVSTNQEFNDSDYSHSGLAVARTFGEEGAGAPATK